MVRKVLGGMLLLVWLGVPVVPAAERGAIGSEVPQGKWWKRPALEKELRLNDEEKGKLDEHFLNYRRRLLDLKSVMEKGWLELDNILEQEKLDEAAAAEQFKRVNAARADLAAEGFQFLLEVRKILGPDRYQRLKDLFKEFREKRRKNR